jgi:FkbM family methyltransferase
MQHVLMRAWVWLPRLYELLGFKNLLRVVSAYLIGMHKVSILFQGRLLHLRLIPSDFQVLYSIYGDLEFEVISDYLKTVDANKVVIFDAGAFIGISSRYFCELDPRIKVIALEPSPTNFELLEMNTRNLKNLRLENFALTSHGLDVSIYDRNTGPWGHSVIESNKGVEFNKIATAKSVGISNLIKKHEGSIKILKLDIEGGELDLLSHAEFWINEVDLIVAELHPQISEEIPRLWYLHTMNMTLIRVEGEKVCAMRKFLGENFEK